MNFEEMSDFEINSAVAVIVTGGDVIERHDMAEAPTDDGVQVIYKVGVHGEFVDYCNNPSDMMPIAFEYGISLIKTNGSSGDDWTCGVANFHDGMWDFDKSKTGECVDFEAYGENPLRAAAICFLKMMEAR